MNLKGVSEHKFHTWGRGGDLCKRLSFFLTCKFWPKLAKLKPSRTLLSSRMSKLCLQSYYILYLYYCLKLNVTHGDICDNVTYNYIIYFVNSCDQNIPYMDKTYLIWKEVGRSWRLWNSNCEPICDFRVLTPPWWILHLVQEAFGTLISYTMGWWYHVWSPGSQICSNRWFLHRFLHIASKISKYAVRPFGNLVQIHTTYVCMISKYFESVC